MVLVQITVQAAACLYAEQLVVNSSKASMPTTYRRTLLGIVKLMFTDMQLVRKVSI